MNDLVALRKEMENTRDWPLVSYVPSRNSIAMQNNLTELDLYPVSSFRLSS